MCTAVGDGSSWLFASGISQADISAAISWGFVQHAVAERNPADAYPGPAEFAARAEILAEFIACPLS